MGALDDLRLEGRVALVTGAAVHFLASEAAGYINGEIMDVNGGVYFD